MRRTRRWLRRFTRFLIPVTGMLVFAGAASAQVKWSRLDVSDILRIDESGKKPPMIVVRQELPASIPETPPPDEVIDVDLRLPEQAPLEIERPRPQQ